MGTIRKVIEVDAHADGVWDIMRDVGAVHTRLAPGFVVATQLEAGARLVEFANGVRARELIVALDPHLRRLAYAISGSAAITHHNASFEVHAIDDGRARVVWTTDFLPDTAATILAPMIETGTRIMQRTLDGTVD